MRYVGIGGVDLGVKSDDVALYTFSIRSSISREWNIGMDGALGIPAVS